MKTAEEIEKDVRNWKAGEHGECWGKCPARNPEPCADPQDGFCEVTGSFLRIGMPCPVRRLKLALGLENVSRRTLLDHLARHYGGGR